MIYLHQWACNSFFYNHLAWRKSHTLFEPVGANNLKVGNWSRYCKSHILVKNVTNFCKVWIGVRWDPITSKFRYESKNRTLPQSALRWSNFKYPENRLDTSGGPDQCKYRTYDKKGKWVLR